MRTCVIRAASHMSGETYDYICREAEKKYGALSFTRVNDDALLGGFVLDVDGEITDLSFASQLAAAEKQLCG